MSCGFFLATRKTDGERDVLWIYYDAAGRQCVSAARTHGARYEDFHVLGQMPDPFAPFHELDNVGA